MRGTTCRLPVEVEQPVHTPLYDGVACPVHHQAVDGELVGGSTGLDVVHAAHASPRLVQLVTIWWRKEEKKREEVLGLV